MALYNKYRPQFFSDVVGQDHIIPILKQAAKENSFSHAYLLVGPRGTGKTTTARLIAKALNCTREVEGKAVSSDKYPCEECDNCRIFSQSSFMDVIEIDAASNTGVDEMRDVIEKSQFAPSIGKAKIYIIDEVHMLSKQAFNALLKTLEEPPSHAYFILATTEIQKVPITIVSRCQRFDFHRIEKKVLIDRLQYIANKEGVEAELPALIHIAKNSDGGMRDAINVFDQVISDNKVTEKKVEECLGLVRSKVIDEFIILLLENKSFNAIELVEKLYSEGINIPQFIKETLKYIKEIIFEDLSENNFNDPKTRTLLSISNILIEKDLKKSTSPLFELELLIYKITFSNNAVIQVPSKKVDSIPVKQDNNESYLTHDVDMSKVGIPTIAAIKEKLSEISHCIKSSSIKTAFKLVNVEDIKDMLITFSIGTSFNYENLKSSESISDIEAAIKEVFDKEMNVKIILKKIEVKEKDQTDLVDDALKIFSKEE